MLKWFGTLNQFGLGLGVVLNIDEIIPYKATRNEKQIKKNKNSLPCTTH